MFSRLLFTSCVSFNLLFFLSSFFFFFNFHEYILHLCLVPLYIFSSLLRLLTFPLFIPSSSEFFGYLYFHEFVLFIIDYLSPLHLVLLKGFYFIHCF